MAFLHDVHGIRIDLPFLEQRTVWPPIRTMESKPRELLTTPVALGFTVDAQLSPLAQGST